MHKTILLAGALAAALVFVQPAAAQHRHGGHSHGGHGHSHGHHHHQHHGHYHGGFGHLHFGLGNSYYPSYGYGSLYGSPYYSYSPPAYYSYPSVNYQYYPPTSSAPPAVEQTPTNQAQIQVVLPNPDAEVTFDGTKTSSVGRIRLYNTPTLDPGRTNSYRIGASWMHDGQPVTDVRLVTVTPGRTVVVDFTQPVTESVPLPK